MARIFSVLAVLSFLLLTTSVLLGLRVGPYNEQYIRLLVLNRHMQELQSQGLMDDLEQLKGEADRLQPELQSSRRRAALHVLSGTLAGLVTVLVHSISVTYFIGTNRWCKEVVETYGLPPSLAEESRRFKRSCFPWALSGILAVFLIVTLGAACDPATLRTTTADWVVPHYAAAMGGGVWLVFSFWQQASCIRQNSEIVEQILKQVRTIRQSRGLETET